MKQELKILLTTLSFYTRIPVGEIQGWSEKMLSKSTRYLPFVGTIVGGVGALVFVVSTQVLPVSVAVLLCIVATILFTGAFHEDGFADFCDGFGGGYTPERILDIMKDSRIGTYGTIGLFAILATKFFALAHIETARIPIIIIVGHTFSRIFPVLLIYTSKYVRLDASSKTKPVGKADSTFSLLFALFSGVVSLCFLSWQEALLCTMVLLVVFVCFRNFIFRKLGGYTGDVLGALQQLCEVFFYLTILAYQNYL